MMEKMKRLWKVVAVCMVFSVGMDAANVQGTSPSSVGKPAGYGAWMSPKDLNLTKLVCLGYKMRVMIQVIAKDYLYAGNNIAVIKARKEMNKTHQIYKKKYQALKKAAKAPALKNLVIFIKSTFDETEALLKEPYSQANAIKIIENGEMISEAHLKISRLVQKKIKSAPVPFRSQDYYIHQIAKYYIAYQSGIRDEVSVTKMKKAVNELNAIIKSMSADPVNTVKMNVIMTRINHYWDIVHQFYIDIDEGGLPLVVYQTVGKIAKNFTAYSKLRMDIIRAEMEGKIGKRP